MPDADGPLVRRSSLRQQIADALRDEILTGRMRAGRNVTVRHIAETYGVSATPVREALVDLSAQGLLEVEQHRGFQVRRFTAEDFRSLTEARAMVAEAAFLHLGEDGIRDLPPDGLASLRRRAEAAARAARAGELDVLVGCDLRFWRELAAFGGNPHLVEFLDRVRTQAWIYAVPHLRALPDVAGACWSGYVALADAVAARDTAETLRLTRACTAHTRALVERLARSGSEPKAGPEAGTEPEAGAEPEAGTDPGAGPEAGTEPEPRTGPPPGTGSVAAPPNGSPAGAVNGAAGDAGSGNGSAAATGSGAPRGGQGRY